MTISGLLLRTATDLDVEKIRCWLLDQNQREVSGSFWCNWRLTLERHDEKELIVAVLNCEPVAYIWEDFGILEVHEEYRQKGIGKYLVGFAVTRAINKNKHAISIKCAPDTSIPFWKKMGFELYSRDMASIVFEKSLRMPSNGTPVKVDVSFYPEKAKWESEAVPVKSFHPSALRDSDGVVHLECRVAAFVDQAHYDRDAVVKICLDDKEIYFDKAKYSQAEELGITYNSGAFSIEKIFANKHKQIPSKQT